MELLRPIAELVRSQRVEGVKLAIHLKYGFEPSDEYCHDLIQFVEALGPPQEAIDEP